MVMVVVISHLLAAAVWARFGWGLVGLGWVLKLQRKYVGLDSKSTLIEI
jgi:hypothetical protein